MSPRSARRRHRSRQQKKIFLREKSEWAALEGGYAHMHSTKPQTLAASLNDSPVGLAAWIGEKFRAWSDCDGDVERVFSKDDLLTNISLYWHTQSIGTSIQMYWENRLQPMRFAGRATRRAAGRFRAFSEGDQSSAAQLARTNFQRRAMDRYAERRTFRGDGKTWLARGRDSPVLQAAAGAETLAASLKPMHDTDLHTARVGARISQGKTRIGGARQCIFRLVAITQE